MRFLHEIQINVGIFNLPQGFAASGRTKFKSLGGYFIISTITGGKQENVMTEA